MDALKHLLALNMLVGVGKTILDRLIKAFGSPENIFSASVAYLR
jgi:excinuclease UvrABC nuclease subunit